MANNRTLTAANSVLMISVAGLFDAPRRIQGYSTEDMFSGDAIENSEVAMGVDGRLSAGWVPREVRMTITLQADSQSSDMFEQWYASETQLREKLIASGSLTIQGTQRKYAMVRGFLTSYMPFPPAGRTLRPRPMIITWETLMPAPALPTTFGI